MVKNTTDFTAGLLKAWRDEKLSAGNYRALAEKEQHPERRKILVRLAEAEDRHADRWEQRLRELGSDPGEFHESLTEKIQRGVLLKSDIVTAIQMLENGEAEADKLYDILLKNAPAASDRTAILEAQKEERAHSKILEEFQTPRHSHPQSRLDHILRHEKWHVHAGGWIGQAVYGVNDGLGAAFGVVSGVAGATAVKGDWILLSGFATMLASALSMGSGAYLATKSEREVYEAEIGREKREIEENPEEEKEELQLIYQLKGFTEDEAKTLVRRLADQPDQMLKTLAHEELGLSEQSFPNEWISALSATISTAVGASIPVLPFLFTTGMQALVISFIISTAAHFAVGASKVLVTGRSWIKSGAEMTLIGIGEAAITYAIGMLIAPMLH